MNEIPYYAVIFTSQKKTNSEDYNKMALQIEKLSSQQEGFIGIQSVRGDDGFGITVSYWKTLEDIAKWKSHSDHQDAQQKGKSIWYSGYEVRICKVEQQYSFGKI